MRQYVRDISILSDYGQKSILEILRSVMFS